jgi:hypothetical protein
MDLDFHPACDEPFSDEALFKPNLKSRLTHEHIRSGFRNGFHGRRKTLRLNRKQHPSSNQPRKGGNLGSQTQIN